MANEVTKTAGVEQALIMGNLANLTEGQRLSYYQQTCASLGLNPLTQPFAYITLNGKLTLYARKDATDQLRKIHGVSIGKPDIQFQDDLIIVAVSGRDKTGREDSEIGVVKKTDMRGDMANALMKALTKAKRRLTLSICGLGMLDETEIETIPPEVITQPATAIENKSSAKIPAGAVYKRLLAKDAELFKKGLCGKGDLIRYVQDAAAKANIETPLASWGEAEVDFAKEAIDDFIFAHTAAEEPVVAEAN